MAIIYRDKLSKQSSKDPEYKSDSAEVIWLTATTVPNSYSYTATEGGNMFAPGHSPAPGNTLWQSFRDQFDGLGIRVYEPGIFFSSSISSPAQNLIYVRAQAEPSFEIPLPSEPEPSLARKSNLLSSPSRAWLGF